MSKQKSNSGIYFEDDGQWDGELSFGDPLEETHPARPAYQNMPLDERTLLENIGNQYYQSDEPPDTPVEVAAAIDIVRSKVRLQESTTTLAETMAHLHAQPDAKLCKQLGNVIRDKRKRASITRQSLATQLRCDYQWLVQLENGLLPAEQIPDTTLEAIASLLCLSLPALELLRDVDEASLKRHMRDISED